MAYNVKAVSSISPEPNIELEDISENEDFFDELQLNRSPYNPTLENITEDEDDLFTLMDGFECPTPVDTNNNTLQEIVELYSSDGDVNVISKFDVDDQSGVNDVFSQNGCQDSFNDVDIIGDVDEFIVLDSFTYDDADVNAEKRFSDDVNAKPDCSINGDVEDGVNVSPGYNNGETINVGAENGSCCDGDTDADVNLDCGNTIQEVNSGDIENNIDNEEENDVNSRSDVTDEDDVIVVSSEEECDEMLITSINLTLSKTEKFKDGKVQSVSRSASIGYSENLCEQDIKENVKNIFDYVQNEFTK